MKTVIYLDVLLLVNFLIAYFLLQAVGLLCGASLSFWRGAAGAALASLSTLILLAPELPGLCSLAFKAASALAVTLAAFGFCAWRPFLRQAVWFFLLNIGLAGLVLLAVTRGGASGMEMNNLTVYIGLSPLLLLGCTLGVYGALRLVLFLFGLPQPVQRWQLRLALPEAQMPVLTALHDTGFLLRDPLGGCPALLVSYPACRQSLPQETRLFLDGFFAGGPQPPPARLQARLIPCKTAAGSRLLPALGGFSLSLWNDAKRCTLDKALVVFTDQTLADGGVQALFGSEFLQSALRASKERSTTLCTET